MKQTYSVRERVYFNLKIYQLPEILCEKSNRQSRNLCRCKYLRLTICLRQA